MNSASLRTEILFDLAGTLHNQGLDSFDTNCTLVEWTPINIIYCAETVAGQLGMDTQYLFNTLHINDSLYARLVELYNADDLGEQIDFAVDVVEYSKTLLVDSIGFTHMAILDTLSYMLENDAYDYESLYEIFENTSYSWREKEGIEGALGVLSYSTSYWNWEEPDPPVPHMDLAGFLFGWAYAVYQDYKDDGNVLPEDQWDRLTAGAWSGIGFSIGISKWGK